MEPLTTVFYIIILIISVILHELAHGYAAYQMGDPTPKIAGRLTLNPLKHLDWLGSVIVPLLLVISQVGIVLGWAKPVPFNPHNLSNKKWGPAIVAAVGPLVNIVLAIIFGLALRIMHVAGFQVEALNVIFSGIVLINLVLAIFNLIPVPPLDGHHILFSFIPAKYEHFKNLFRKYGIVLFLVVILFLWKYIAVFVYLLYNLLVGSSATFF